jgi:signal transduction histidine kinase
MTDDSTSIVGGAEHLKVHPSVLFKLGEDLITDELQALVELIKNSYDANSPAARVEIDTDLVTVSPVGADKDRLIGSITIKDSGNGMTRQELLDGWLTVSNSWKKQYKTEGRLPPGHIRPTRTPLGDKGLGRLGAQRLGDVLEVETRSKLEPNQAWRVVIPWREFDNAASLDEVPISVEPLGQGHPKGGTTLRILGLKTGPWADPGARKELQKQLATLISPFGQQRGFQIEITINGMKLDLYEVTRQVRSAAELSYQFNYKSAKLQITAGVKRDFFKPNTQNEWPAYQLLMEADNGRNFTDWLRANRSADIKRFGISSGFDQELFHTVHEIDVVDRSSNLIFEDHSLVDPGPFNGEVDSVDLGIEQPSTFDTRAEYREFVKAINGIKVYRNGFGIRTHNDWLNLGARWGSGKSYYSLKPGNVIGYIDITADSNPQLEEVTDREGFRTTPAYQNFLAILQIWLDYTGDLQTMLRRAWNDYSRSAGQSDLDSASTATPEALLKRMDRTIRDIGESRAPLRKARGELDRQRRRAANAANSEAISTEQSKQMTEVASTIEATADSVTAVSIEVEAILDRLQNDRAAIVLIQDQVEVLRAQLADAWATVALGITAEALTHEMLVITDKLRGNTRALDRYLNANHLHDPELRRYLEYVRSSITALAKQLDHLNPGLSYVRDRRDKFDVGDALTDICAFYGSRFADLPVSINLNIAGDFRVRMSRGRFVQILDNLILNSEYWIRQLQKRSNFEGVVSITCIRPRIDVSDNGPGISPSVEDTLFEPFVTTKPRDRRGRGLGLFVVRQLLDADGGTIALSAERGADGRRRMFEIGLGAAAREAQ